MWGWIRGVCFLKATLPTVSLQARSCSLLMSVWLGTVRWASVKKTRKVVTPPVSIPLAPTCSPSSPLPLLPFPLLSLSLLFPSSPALLPLPGLSVDLRHQVWQKPRLSRKTRGLKAHKFHAVQHANVPSADKRAFNPAALLLSTPLPLSLLSLCHSISLFHSLFFSFSFFLYLFVFYVYCLTLNYINPLLYSARLFFFYPNPFISIAFDFVTYFSPLPPWRPLPLLTGPCALWSSWRCPSTAATGPTWHLPRLAPTWPKSWRSTPRCPSIMQALTLKCSGSARLLQRCPPAKPHPKPSKVRQGCWWLFLCFWSECDLSNMAGHLVSHLYAYFFTC